MLNGAREMSDEEKAYVEGLVMQTYDRFLNIVAEARKQDPNVLRNGVADGRILSGTDALANKLVDQLGYVEDAYTKARELGGSPGAEVVRYKREISLARFFRMFGESSKAPGDQVRPHGQRSEARARSRLPHAALLRTVVRDESLDYGCSWGSSPCVDSCTS